MRGTALSTQHSAFRGGLTWLGERLRALVAVVREALREIFDEAAYARFLQRHQCASTPQAYAHFMEERDPGRKPRCC
jgi:hypothetical protein